jgi:hypothetical protein
MARDEPRTRVDGSGKPPHETGRGGGATCLDNGWNTTYRVGNLREHLLLPDRKAFREATMAEEEKGFVIKDKRTFSEDRDGSDEKKHEEPGQETATEEESVTGEAGSEADEFRLPEVSFSTLIFSISSSVLLHFGEIPDPETGEKKKNLPIAKHSIDVLSMLEEKTKGNLTEDEEQLLTNILYDLRMKYVNEKT